MNEKVKKEETKCCGNCKFYDPSRERQFKRFGIREGLIETRSVCINPESKSHGHLVMKESANKPCWTKGTFVSEKKEEKAKVKEPKKKKTIVPKKEVTTGKNSAR
jgi:hypothetical protein